MKLKTFACILLSLLFINCSSQPSPAVYGGLGHPADPVPFMENVRTGFLPSGLRYFILENSMPENRAYLTLAVNAGSVLEEENERGFAHFVEHMAFRGTERFPEMELVNYLRSLGMRFGPEVNAYTGFDQTVYGIEVPTETSTEGIKVIPGTALAVIDDWSRAVAFLPEAVESERPVIIEEYRSRLGAWDRIRRQWLPVLFKGSPYALRMPIGLPEIIQEAAASGLEGFYRKWYQADNMALVFVGDFDADALEESLTDHFKIEKPNSKIQKPVFDLPPPVKKTESLILTDPELTSTNVYIYFKRNREARRADLSYFREEIIDILIDNMLSFRFNDELQKPQTPYVYAGAGTSNYGFSSRFYVMVAQAKTGGAEASLNELLRAKETMLRYGFTNAELDLAKDSLVSYLQRLVTEKDRQPSEKYVDYLVDYYIKGGNLADVEWELEAVESLLPHIKAKDINNVIKNYFASGDVQVFIFAPEADLDKLPGENRIRQMVTQSNKIKISRPKQAKTEDGLLSGIPRKGEIISEFADEETDSVFWELSNGAKVILKPTKNKNDEIVLYAMARGGTSSAGEKDNISASLAVEMTQVSGLGPWSHPELTRKLAGKQVSLSYSVSVYNRSFRGSSNTGDLSTFFEMLHLNFTDPRIDPEAVKAMLDQYKTSLAHRTENPGNVFSDEVTRTVYGNHPRFMPLVPEDLAKVDIETALDFIFMGLNPADYTFVFTGNLDFNIMGNYVETYIASIPQRDAWNKWTELDIKRPGKIEKIVNKGKEEQSRVFMAWFADSPFTDKLNAESQVLSEYLEIIMNDEIREKLGGVYSIGANVRISPVPKGELIMQISFACDPGRVQELTDAVLLQLKRLTDNNIDSDVFNKAVEALKKEWEVSMQSNGYIANSFANSSVLLNLPLVRLYNRSKEYEAVTAADIRRVCLQLMQNENNGPVRVVLFPE